VNPWNIAAVTAAALVLVVAIYVVAKWRRAPAAFRAIGAVAGICFVAGFLVGIWGLHLASAWYFPPSGPSRSSALAGSVSALEVGKAIIKTDEKHAGEPMWMPSSSAAEMCKHSLVKGLVDKGLIDKGLINKGPLDDNSPLCRIAYLARHAEGQDLDRGPKGDSVSLSDVADFCDAGTIDKSFDICKEAYDARHTALK
jgi:hypothetical protein